MSQYSMSSTRLAPWWILVAAMAFSPLSRAADPAPKAGAPAAAAAPGPEKLNVDSLKQKYWEKSEETDLRVVQNRVFSKAHRLELQAFFGFLSSDPFLSVKALGGGLAYHLTEHFAFGLVYFKDIVKRSSALYDLETQVNRTANVNPPQSYLAAEVLWSPIYGKLSFLGESIIHYDLHVSFGGGPQKTVNGSYTALHLGIGQQVYLSKHFALKVDYRLIRYSEEIIDRANTLSSTYLQAISRTNYTDSITVGLGFFI